MSVVRRLRAFWLSMFRSAAVVVAVSALSLASAHGSKAGDIEIGHPFATPSLDGSVNGAAYFASLENTGGQADKLLRASTPAAASVELHTMNVDAQGVMRMRQVDGVELAPKSTLKMRPGLGYHLMLAGLKQPLREGSTFPMTLEFQRAGKVEVKVVVQTPKPRDAPTAPHMH